MSVLAAFAPAARHRRVPPLGSALTGAAPGLALVGACVAVAYAAAALVPMLSPLIWAVFIGMAVVAVRPLGARFEPGVRLAARRLLRLGVALLGLRLAAGQLVGVGLPGLAVVLLVVPLTIGGTHLLGRRLGCPPGLVLLVATGSAICGASAIVAMDAAVDGGEDDVTVAVATVTLFGTLALVLLPLLDTLVLHLPATTFGTWVGASVHEVAQVVSAATPAGAAAVKVASVVKLTRVLMLAPLVLAVSLLRRRGEAAGRGAVRRAPVPLFVAGFLLCVAVATTGAVPPRLMADVTGIDVGILTASLAGLGLSVDVRRILHLGWRPMALGLGSWVIAA
ncbi:MAG TPA: putative sulfate exporter family transporter, partial [Candidatus Dormibacteraeota bacterium]